MTLEKVNYNGIQYELTKELAEVFNHFLKKSSVVVVEDFVWEQFVKLFSILYLNDIRGYYRSEKVATSNWTQHTAATFYKTSQIMDFLCDFEVENRHDGAIRGADGHVYLCAEWEFNASSVLGKAGEIQKLYKTVSKYKTCAAMLFTYVVDINYKEFADKIYSQWNQLLNESEDYLLYFSCALMKRDEIEKLNHVYGIRTLVFGKGTVDVWDDYLSST
jgi:hypothetical protein